MSQSAWSHPGEGIVQDGAAAPVATEVAGLIDVIDVIGIAAQEKRPEIVLHGRNDGEGTLGERRTAQAVQPRLARLDFDDHKPDTVRRRADRLDIGNP